MENVIEALKILKKYVDSFEEMDPQYKALKKVAEAHGLKALGVVVGNALVSYKLRGTGEEYWNEFGDFFVSRKPTFDNLVRFLTSSKYNVALREQKLKRLKKAKALIEKLEVEPLRYLNLNTLLSEVARTLGARGTEKTVTFAAKMAYYFFKALGYEVSGDVPVPIDSRIATVTCSSGLLDASVEEIMSKRRDEAVRAWARVAEEAGVKTLHLDALVWLPARGLRRALCRGLEEGKATIEHNLKSLGVEEAGKVAELLVRRKCC